MNLSKLFFLTVCITLCLAQENTVADNSIVADTSPQPSSRRVAAKRNNNKTLNIEHIADDVTSSVISASPVAGSAIESLPDAQETSGLLSSSRHSAPLDKLSIGMGRIVAGIACIATLALVATFIGKSNTKSHQLDQAARLNLVSTLKIGPRCCLTLVSANGQSFLVARDASGVKNIVPVPKDFDSLVSADLEDLESRMSLSGLRSS